MLSASIYAESGSTEGGKSKNMEQVPLRLSEKIRFQNRGLNRSRNIYFGLIARTVRSRVCQVYSESAVLGEGDGDCVRSVARTWTAEDGCGNSVSATRTVTVEITADDCNIGENRKGARQPQCNLILNWTRINTRINS